MYRYFSLKLFLNIINLPKKITNHQQGINIQLNVKRKSIFNDLLTSNITVMNNQKVIITLYFVLFSHFIFGQSFQAATITYFNNETKSGFVEIPKTPIQKSIKFKLNKDDKSEEKIKMENIKSFSVQSEDGNTYIFEKLRLVPLNQKKPTTGFRWLLLRVAGYANLYEGSHYYSTDKKGNIEVLTDCGTNGSCTFSYYIKKDNTDIAYILAMTPPEKKLSIGLNSILIKKVELYLYEYPELVERVKNKEFTHRDVLTIIQIYNDYMKTQDSVKQI